MTREERVKQRERELFMAVEELKEAHFLQLLPLVLEIEAIRASRGPREVYVNGQTYRYTGALPVYRLPEERGDGGTKQPKVALIQ